MMHAKYYKIPAYQILARKDDATIAKALGISTRTLHDRIIGRSDFRLGELQALSDELNAPIAELIATE